MPHPLYEDVVLKPHLIVGIFGVAAAIILRCVAGIYPATNPAAALATAATACIAFVVGVKWVAGS